MIRPLVSAAWLVGELDHPLLRIVDTRWYLPDGEQGRREYESDHIPGAIFLDLDKDLSAGRGPGRHPLPGSTEFATTLSTHGIGNGNHVVVYDDGSGAIASRLWWMLRNAGHHRVSVLDGGYHLWRDSGYRTTAESPEFAPVTFQIGASANRTINRDELLADLGNVQLIDARSAERYRGEIKPVDAAAGHIPTAVSAPTAGNLEGDGRFKSPEQLANRFVQLGIDASEPVISSCGSGVTACHNILALHIAGFGEAILYPGSWSDWSSSSYPIATGPRPGSAPART